VLWWVPAILIAVEYAAIVLVAAFSAAVASYGPGLRMPDVDARRAIFRAVSVAIWTAPFVILFLQRSALTGVVAAGVVISVFFVLGITERERPEIGVSLPVVSPGAWAGFSAPDARRFAMRLALVIAASGLMQAAMLANWIAKREIALLLFVLGAALLALRSPSIETPRESTASARNGKAPILSAALATCVIAIGLIPLLMPLGGGHSSIDAFLRNLSSKTAPLRIVNSHAVRIEHTHIQSDGYIGVILTPRQEIRKELVTLPQLDLSRQSGAMPRPLTIRFTGSYWFFQYPFVRPPFDSITAEGDPARIGVRSSNYMPLLMEAVQTLDEPIATAHLQRIQLAMRDVDPDPNTISIELILVDSSAWGHPLQSLGSQPLSGTPAIENATISHSDTLTFSVPANSHFRQFNEMRLIFRLATSRNEHAAAISIEDFVLVPRGA
jgi:hypothetical protein